MPTSPGNLVKGRLTIALTGEYREFSLNPESIKTGHGYDLVKNKIAGISHPHTQPGAGGDQSISFDLPLDCDVGYRHRRNGDSGPAMDLTDEINWYHHLTLPEGAATLGNPGSEFPLLLFSYGSLFQAMPVQMTNCGIEVTQMSPELLPMKASLSITLERKISQSIDRSSVYSVRTARNF